MPLRALPDEPLSWSSLHPILRESWRRSSTYVNDPGEALAPIDMTETDLREYRRNHPLATVLPVFERLLIEPATQAGLIVAIGDAQGRLLWVEGDRSTRRRAEASAFQAGANWSERAIGTSAPGTALATGGGVQVHQEEHFALVAHQFSCSAVPVHCPHTGGLLGVVDLTGGAAAVATHSLPLVQAAVSAAVAELRALPAMIAEEPQITSLGCPSPSISTGSLTASLSLRHAELMVLLTWYGPGPDDRRETGLTAAALAEMVYGEPGHEVALRAELVRLRKMLAGTSASGTLDLQSRPYRLTGEVGLDAQRVVTALATGDRDTALDFYGGPLLPQSDAPGIARLRTEMSMLIRESMIQDGSAGQLWRYLQLDEACHDREVVMTALRILPPDSPQRAMLMARMQL